MCRMHARMYRCTYPNAYAHLAAREKERERDVDTDVDVDVGVMLFDVHLCM